ncbi:UvrD-helicase domain-containing protein [Bradyrhizobium sp. 142]|uniref:UvrD-helicase domain-containing protein n=1 Tax=Bradyrhizobium sp. 142 TaxID=2782618 RepID=UPI002097F6B8|nr:UvrD-helicase domain-containing protein [Bradyrhizobium sp. 142]
MSQPATWSNAVLRPGALFLVGDHKQAIYRFRSADVESYALAKSVIGKTKNGWLLAVTANFRSRPEIMRTSTAYFRTFSERRGSPASYRSLRPLRCRRCRSLLQQS